MNLTSTIFEEHPEKTRTQAMQEHAKLIRESLSQNPTEDLSIIRQTWYPLLRVGKHCL